MISARVRNRRGEWFRMRVDVSVGVAQGHRALRVSSGRVKLEFTLTQGRAFADLVHDLLDEEEANA